MLLVLSTFPNAAKARLIGKLLVAEHRAACVTLLPKAESFFEWEGRMETASEVLAIFKTSEAGYPGLEVRLNELHPYDVPEIVAVPVARGLPAYIEWVSATCAGPAPADPGIAPMK